MIAEEYKGDNVVLVKFDSHSSISYNNVKAEVIDSGHFLSRMINIRISFSCEYLLMTSHSQTNV